MDKIQLKMAPRLVYLVAESIDRDLDSKDAGPEWDELNKVRIWLRYRYDKAVSTITAPPGQ
jgi:hypothetical protein